MTWAYAWRLRLKVWLPPLALFVLALALALLYRWAFAGEAEFRQQRFQQRSSDLAQLGSERRQLEELVARVQASQDSADSFFSRRLDTEERQLTRVLAEVRRLCRRAGLQPAVISYGRQMVEAQQVLKRSIRFTVEGTYVDLRKLINLLELSELFLTLEEISLSGGERGVLRINLTLATYFVAEGPTAAASGGMP